MVETHINDGFTHIIPIIFRLLTASFKPRITTCFSVATENEAMTKTTTRGEWEELSLLDIARYTMNPWLLLAASTDCTWSPKRKTRCNPTLIFRWFGFRRWTFQVPPMLPNARCTALALPEQDADMEFEYVLNSSRRPSRGSNRKLFSSLLATGACLYVVLGPLEVTVEI